VEKPGQRRKTTYEFYIAEADAKTWSD
jgi:hypothetical protein